MATTKVIETVFKEPLSESSEIVKVLHGQPQLTWSRRPKGKQGRPPSLVLMQIFSSSE